MDPFEDIFSENSVANAPAVNKFQPKAKPRPKKAASKSVPSAICSVSKTKVAAQASNELHAGQDVQQVDVADKIPESPVLPSIGLEDTSMTEKSSERDKDPSFGALLIDEKKNSQLMNSSSQHGDSCSGAEVPDFDENGSLDVSYKDAKHSQPEMLEGNCHPSSENLVVVTDVYSTLELGSFDEVINTSTNITDTDNLHNQIGTDDHPWSKSISAVHNYGEGCSFLPLGTQISEIPIIFGNMDIQKASHVHVSSDYLSPRICDTSEAQVSATDFMDQDQGICSGDAISNQNRESKIETQKSQTELPEIAGADFEIMDLMPGTTALPKSCVGKYQPRPKVQIRKPKATIVIPGSDTFSPVRPPATQAGTLESRQIDDASGHADGGAVPRDYSCDPHLNEELTSIEETSPSLVPCSDDALPSPAVPEQDTNRKRRSSRISDHSQEPTKSSLPGEENGSVNLRRRQKKSVPASSPETDPEQKNDDDEYKGGSKSKKKRAPRKGNKIKDNESPSQKSSKSSIAPKKFPHATQRKRRCVDKNLLDIPEDEIDYRNLRIKDLIILAEVRERLANKASTSNAPPANQSVDNLEHSEYLATENDFSAEQDGDFADDQDTIRAQPNPSFFNYHSFMDRPRSARWSKQETELFYEGVKQFGSDLSLIKQLFPDRDRNQVKQKYKSEERKNRLRLHEALASRSKDYTHFKKLIEQLQQTTGQAEQDPNGDHSIGKLDPEEEEVEELIPEANGKAAKTKQDDELAVENDAAGVEISLEAEEAVGVDAPGVEISLEAEEAVGLDDDDDIWSSYQSIY